MPEASQLVAGGRAERHHWLSGKMERIPGGYASIFCDPTGIGMDVIICPVVSLVSRSTTGYKL